MMKIFAFKTRQLKEKIQDANFSLPIKNPESAIKKRIPDPDSKIGQKLGGFRIAIPSLYVKYLLPPALGLSTKNLINLSRL